MTFDVMFTGHRPPKICGGYDEDHPKAAAVRDWLRRKVAQMALDGARKFVSGGALGTDQWGAEAVLDRPDLFLTMAIPCDDYCSSWPQASQERFKSMLRRSASVEIVCPGPYASYKNIVRDQWMVDRSKKVLAIWDGNEQGGTWHTIKAARKAKLPITILNPNDMSERQE